MSNRSNDNERGSQIVRPGRNLYTPSSSSNTRVDTDWHVDEFENNNGCLNDCVCLNLPETIDESPEILHDEESTAGVMRKAQNKTAGIELVGEDDVPMLATDECHDEKMPAFKVPAQPSQSSAAERGVELIDSDSPPPLVADEFANNFANKVKIEDADRDKEVLSTPKEEEVQEEEPPCDQRSPEVLDRVTREESTTAITRLLSSTGGNQNVHQSHTPTVSNTPEDEIIDASVSNDPENETHEVLHATTPVENELYEATLVQTSSENNLSFWQRRKRQVFTVTVISAILLLAGGVGILITSKGAKGNSTTGVEGDPASPDSSSSSLASTHDHDPEQPTGNYNYCGSTTAKASGWENANAKCHMSCYGGSDSECPFPERCYAGCTDCPILTEPSKAPPPPQLPDTPDSRLIAYVANWRTCLAEEQLAGYSHLVIAFAVTYQYADQAPNSCNEQCTVAFDGVCGNRGAVQVATWQKAGKKVLLSFGGGGMGGSWAGDNSNSNCWDWCFGKEDALSDSIVGLVESYGFNGINLDYEYCYDVAGDRHGRDCYNSGTGLYSDEKAQNFLKGMTSKLRQKLDAIGPGYELTHTPMDYDLHVDSPYYQILKEQSANINFLMPMFYGGDSRPVLDGFDGSGNGAVSAASIYSNLASDLFPGQPEKVVFGFCIAGCGNTNSNANTVEATQVLQDLKSYNYGEFACNGGVFFWSAHDDVDGAWSSNLLVEVSSTTGCSVYPTQLLTNSSLV